MKKVEGEVPREGDRDRQADRPTNMRKSERCSLYIHINEMFLTVYTPLLQYGPERNSKDVSVCDHAVLNKNDKKL